MKLFLVAFLLVAACIVVDAGLKPCGEGWTPTTTDCSKTLCPRDQYCDKFHKICCAQYVLGPVKCREGGSPTTTDCSEHPCPQGYCDNKYKICCIQKSGAK